MSTILQEVRFLKNENKELRCQLEIEQTISKKKTIEIESIVRRSEGICYII